MSIFDDLADGQEVRVGGVVYIYDAARKKLKVKNFEPTSDVLPSGLAAIANLNFARGNLIVGDGAQNKWIALTPGSNGFALVADNNFPGGHKYVSIIPGGTRSVFMQTSAPIGWTKLTDHDNKALRVVAGNAGVGGIAGFTQIFDNRTIAVDNLPPHAHGSGTLSGEALEAGEHSHGYNRPNNQGIYVTTSGGYNGPASITVNAPTNTDGAHGHEVEISGETAEVGGGQPLDFRVAYVDVIIARKDN